MNQLISGDSRPFKNQTKIDHSKSRHIWISDLHCFGSLNACLFLKLYLVHFSEFKIKGWV